MGKICAQSNGCIVSIACEQTFAKKFVSCFGGGIYEKEHLVCLSFCVFSHLFSIILFLFLMFIFFTNSLQVMIFHIIVDRLKSQISVCS